VHAVTTPTEQLPAVVITTINEPSESVKAFAALDDWQVVIVGDKKTPDWPHVSERLRFIDIDEQIACDWALAAVLPFNHYCRKNLGYLEAIKAGVPRIADSDDDNRPLPGWGNFAETSRLDCVVAPAVVNIYKLFTDVPIWPRGLPLDLILAGETIQTEMSDVDILVWQGLADGDPDVDAIYRLVVNADAEFRHRDPVGLAPGVVAPMNSQNTVWHPDAYPYLYLPFDVSFRFTDILRGYVAQYGLHAMGSTVAFTSPTVDQDRNEHDLLKDLADEVPVYTELPRILDTLASADLTGDPMNDLEVMYADMERIGAVTAAERTGVAAWLQDIESMESQ